MTGALWNQIRAIMWAQWRSSWNRLPGSNKGSLALTAIIALGWYGSIAALAVGAGFLMADSSHPDALYVIVTGALFLMFLYWQFVPVVMASTGASLDLKRLLIYPVPRGALYGLEVLLRVTSGVEILMALAGAIIGSLFNRALPAWSAAGFLLFIVFNLLLAAGVRDLMVRLFAKKRVRELFILVVITVAALPQFIVLSGSAPKIRNVLTFVPVSVLPWSAAAQIVCGRARWSAFAVLSVWILFALWFGHSQFERSIAIEVEGEPGEPESARRAERFSFLYTWPAHLFRDPTAALIEKQIRSLSRASRFRVVFVMGFTFGLLIWLPMSLGGRHSHSFLSENFFAVVCVYAVMLMTDLLFFNSFGPDCGAVQVYFVIPVSLERVIFARNVAALFFVFADVAIVGLICVVVRLPLTGFGILEALAVCVVLCTFLLSFGNVASVWNPRGVNMTQAFRSGGASRVQWLALIAFPLGCAPLALAYLARFAFDSEAAFFGVLLLFEAVAIYVYKLGLESAAHRAERDRERIIETLSRSSGLVSA